MKNVINFKSLVISILISISSVFSIICGNTFNNQIGNCFNLTLKESGDNTYGRYGISIKNNTNILKENDRGTYNKFYPIMFETADAIINSDQLKALGTRKIKFDSGAYSDKTTMQKIYCSYGSFKDMDIGYSIGMSLTYYSRCFPNVAFEDYGNMELDLKINSIVLKSKIGFIFDDSIFSEASEAKFYKDVYGEFILFNENISKVIQCNELSIIYRHKTNFDFTNENIFKDVDYDDLHFFDFFDDSNQIFNKHWSKFKKQSVMKAFVFVTIATLSLVASLFLSFFWRKDILNLQSRLFSLLIPILVVILVELLNLIPISGNSIGLSFLPILVCFLWNEVTMIILRKEDYFYEKNNEFFEIEL